MLVFAFYATAFLGLSDPATESPIKSNACEVTFRSATPHFIKAKPFVPKLLFRSVYGKLEYRQGVRCIVDRSQIDHTVLYAL